MEIFEEETERSFQAGKILANPPPGEEVVVTGMAGCFPSSDNIHQYYHNLLNKIDMVTCDNSRWDIKHFEIPKRFGKINLVKKFDAGFFGVSQRQAEMMDPMGRRLLEHAVEAIMDAGYNLEQLRGSNTGVFVGTWYSEAEKFWLSEKLESPSHSITGCERSMQAQRISHFLGLEGPCHTIDTACSSSMYAFEHAYRAIRTGICEAALVGGTNLCFNPHLTLEFFTFGVLSYDGKCKSFDAKGDGYVRSETTAMVFLQKSKDSRRIYAQVVHAKVNFDGYKEYGITFPSAQMQRQLVNELYRECNVDPTTIDFLEAHATGTTVGDPVEMQAADEIFCTNRKTPLLVGAVKSNVGHSEAASALCSIIKVLLSMNTDYLLPNIHYNTPRKGVEALEKGRMVVVTDAMPWPNNGSGLVAVNSFGFGGANGHVLFRKWKKDKNNNGMPDDDFPRLICVSGRTQHAVESILDHLKKSPLDAEFVGLVQELFAVDTPGHLSRGYVVLSKQGEMKRSIINDVNKQTLSLVIKEANGSEWLRIGKQLLNIPFISPIIWRAHHFLFPQEINLVDIINKGHASNFTNITMANIVIQIAIVDIIKIIELPVDYIVGNSTGELVAAYADGALTLEETLLSCYLITKCREENQKLSNVCYEVEMDQKYLQAMLPDELNIVENENSNCIISGSLPVMTTFLTKLIRRGVVVIEHQSNILTKETRSKLLKNLREVLPKRHVLATKHLLSTHAQGTVTNYAPAEYFVDRLSKPLQFNNTVSTLLSSTTLVCVGTELEEFTNFNTTCFLSTKENSPYSILNTLGTIYLLGHSMKLAKLYSAVEFPVSAGTPTISPLIKWNHSTDWYTTFYRGQKKISTTGNIDVEIALKATEWTFLVGHNINGRILFPAAGYLVMIWNAFSTLIGELSFTRIAFENIKFIRATNMPKVGKVIFNIIINIQTGLFEIGNMQETVVTGKIFIPKTSLECTINPHIPIEDNDTISYSTKDIYKELKLRGYNYSGEFRALSELNLTITKGLIKWSDNWITFIDNMFQIKIMHATRNLYVPTDIAQLIIDPDVHKKYVDTIGEDSNLPVFINTTTNIIRSGGIEVKGLSATLITKQKDFGVPVLETYKFVPFECELSTEHAIRVLIQIILENTIGTKLRMVEVFEGATQDGFIPLGPAVFDVLNDLPLIHSDLVVFSDRSDLEVCNVKVQNKKLAAENNSCALIIVWRFFCRKEIKFDTLNALQPKGIILSREAQTFIPTEVHNEEFDILSIYDTGKEKLVLLRRHVEITLPNVIDLSGDTNLDWLPKLQNLLDNDEGLLVYAQNSPKNGILGFTNCLRREVNAANLKCVFVQDENQILFNLKHEFYLNQIRKGLAINVFQNGKWGTYRHLKLSQDVVVQKEHVFNIVAVKGDLSSVRWIEGPLKSTTVLQPEQELVKIYYAGLNFKDIMMATGRLNNDGTSAKRIDQYNVQGLEFAGRDHRGRRVMGMTLCGALASMMIADSYMLWEIPDSISMKEATTIPIVYATVLHGFILVANIQQGQSILIHTGTGGVGQAAINVAIHYQCNIFTTVGSQEKRDFIRKKFPQIPESQIGNSRNTSFEHMVLTGTNGRGVDIVLNSLAEEKLKASIRCLAPGGKFLEIGKFDLSINNFVDLEDFKQGRSFHGVMTDIYPTTTPQMKMSIINLIRKGAKEGYVKPLNTTIFSTDQVEEALRYMANGKYTGKIAIKIRDEESGDVEKNTQLFNGLPRFYGNSDKCYIISGGLGGFGLELADWLVTRGVRKLVLVSRTGIQNGYQSSRIRIWNSYGVITKISTADTTTMEGCATLIMEANEIGAVEGIFNLAAILKDGMIENQNVDSFMTSLLPKSIATHNFDALSRKMCPELKYFVVFSSLVSGRGNVGQSNYGMANSIMERICEQRKKEGFPALAIQWGAIGEVGLVADMQDLQMDMEIGGTLQQRLVSCFEVMDLFLNGNETIVASMVVAEKKSSAVGTGSVIEAVKTILGIRDLKSTNLNSSLSEMGMDSIMAVEIKQTLEREYGLYLSAQELRNLTFARLEEVNENSTQETAIHTGDEQKSNPKPMYLLRYIVDEENSTVPLIRMETLAKTNEITSKVFLFPGIEGISNIMKPLTLNLTCEALCLQYIYKDEPECSIQALAKSLLKPIQKDLPSAAPFIFVAYSFGCVVALEAASLLEAEGRTGRIILIDGSPNMLKELIKLQIAQPLSDPVIETWVLSMLMQLYVSFDIAQQYETEIYNCKTFEDRIKVLLKKLPSDTSLSDKFKRITCLVAKARITSALNYQPSFLKLKSPITLYKPTVETLEGFDTHYQIQELCQNPVDVKVVEGDHMSILKNPQLAGAINRMVDGNDVYLKQNILLDKPENMIVKEDRDKWIQ